ncbi:hypothetical protein DEJ45_06185 [Streptomyces venezuelae]|uniref:hypothetical protein n=1 Tax=Streptomyces venezuelae TaxID=54571 RepID=UPI00123C8B88|nr:hypothetical protein [Streptomyces venezuelae]QES12017.1 hypothetical protein DEJ45_06185 [Streptomyces venezuelae]
MNTPEKSLTPGPRRARRTRRAVTGPRVAGTALALLATALAPLPAAQAAAPRAAACAWTATVLPVPADLNGGGVVTAADSAGGHAGHGEFVSPWGSSDRTVLRWKNGAATAYPVPADLHDPEVTGVDRTGTMVGHGGPLGEEHAFRSRGGVLERLPEPAGTTSSAATGINDSGDIVGHVGRKRTSGTYVYTVDQAVIWPAAAPGTVVALAGLPAGQTRATGIDQDGTVLVEHTPVTTDAFDGTAVHLWRAGTARKLTLPSGTVTVRAASIAAGRVAGTTYGRSGTEERGVLWDTNGTPLRPEGSLSLLSVNRTGQSLGWTSGDDGVWQLDRRVTTLPNAGLNVSADDGSVAGWSRTTTGGSHRPTVWRCR